MGALHRVSAWATANGLTLRPVAVDAKSDESTAIPRLLELLDLRGGVVTLTAAGGPKEIAAAIVAKGADGVLALKDNRPQRARRVAEYFLAQAEAANPHVRCHRQVETAHGRTETRETFGVAAPRAIGATGAWAGLAAVVLVLRHRVEHATGKVGDEVRYFLSSLPARARRLARAVRQHGGIANGLHRVLDVAFHEDLPRLRDRNAIGNGALLNRRAVSLLRQDKSIKAGVKCKRKRAGWDEDYLLTLLVNYA